MIQATVVAVFGRQAICEQDAELVPCSAVGSLLRRNGPLAAGDRVSLERSGDEGIIRAVEARKTALLRQAHRPNQPPRIVAVNVNLVVAVVSIHQPGFSAGLVDRLLAAASICGLEAALCVNKWDLAEAGDDALLSPYAALGAPLVRASATTGEGVGELGTMLRDRRSVVVGHSGVGKSSLLARLVPGLAVRVREVNQVTGRGRHTTTTATLVHLPAGGTIIDTPGIRAFGLHGVTARELHHHLPEFAPHIAACEFEDCEHVSEPGCGVKRAVDGGGIPLSRYEGYLRIRESLLRGRG